MLKRLVVGLILGLVIGGLLAYGLFQLLPSVMGGMFGYAFAALTGVIVGLVAGKPIWAKGAQIEAGLKAVVGALLGAGILFGLRFVSLKVPALGPFPEATLGQHPIAALVGVSTLLAIFYELDNTSEPGEAPKARIAGDKTRVADDGVADLEAEEEQPAAKKRR